MPYHANLTRMLVQAHFKFSNVGIRIRFIAEVTMFDKIIKIRTELKRNLNEKQQVF